MWNRTKTQGSEGREPGTARYDDITELEPDTSGAGLRVAILMSRFNEDIGEGLLAACTEELRACGVAAADVLLATVPGALELPMAAMAAARSGRYDAIVALGCIIRGETYHFEVVSNESARGLMDVQVQTGVPIANAVLTTENDDQALERMHEKGREAARVALEMARLTARLQA